MSKLQTREVTWQEHDDAGRPVWRSYDVEYEWDGHPVISGVWTDEDLFDLLTSPGEWHRIWDRIESEITARELEKEERIQEEDFVYQLGDMACDRRRDEE